MKLSKFFLVACSVMLLTLLTHAQSFLTNGLVAYYPFNGNANDASGNGNNGTIYGGVTLAPDRFGTPNSAYLCNGTDGYIDIGNPVGNSPAYLTECAWVKIISRATNGYGPNDVIITKRQDPSGLLPVYWATLFVSPGGNGVLTAEGAFHETDCTSTTQTPTNVWVFLCGVVSNGTYKIYINGALENTVTDGIALNSIYNMYLMHDVSWGTFCNGVIDDVSIYNRALSANEVAQLYAYESTPPNNFLTNGLVAYYPFTGSANDASGNGNDGTPMNGVSYVPSPLGSSASLNGNSQYVVLPNTISNYEDLSVTFWVNTSDYTLNGFPYGEFLVSRDIAGYAYDWNICLEQGRKVDFVTDADELVTPFDLNSNNWIQVACVADSIHQQKLLFVNGQPVASTSWLPNPFANNGVPIFLGASTADTASHAYFTGGLSDVRFYNRALSSNEVAQLYAYESTPPNNFLTNGLVAYYPFNGNANDASGNGNNGTVNGANLTPDRLGNANSAYSFNGINNNISFASLPLTQVDNWTMTAWLKPASLNQAGIAVSMGYDTGSFSGGNGYAFGILGANGYPYYVTPGNQLFGAFSTVEGFYGGFTFTSTNQWYQVVMMRSAGVTTFYVNGVATPNGSTSTPVTPTAFMIGSENGIRYFNGAIDDVRIYNRAISSIEVAQLFAYDSGSNTNPPSITGQPQPVIANAGDNISFSVTAIGTTPLSYQWSINGTNILGATSSSLTISNIIQTDLGAYAVVVSNPFGSTNSTAAMLSMYPFIETPFVGAITYWGTDNTLSLEGWGTGPLHYQWFKNGVALLNATNQTLFLPAIQFTNAGLYSVVLSSPLGSVTNIPAQVVVNPAGVSIGMYPGIIVSGVVGYTYRIQASSDLTNTNGWTTTATLTLLQPVQLWVDISVNALSPANPHKYYRVVPGG